MMLNLNNINGNNLEEILDLAISKYDIPQNDNEETSSKKIKILDTNIDDVLGITLFRKLFHLNTIKEIEILLQNPFSNSPFVESEKSFIYLLNCGLFKIRKAIDKELSIEKFQFFYNQEVALEQLYDIVEKSKLIDSSITIKFHKSLPTMSYYSIFNYAIWDYFRFSNEMITPKKDIRFIQEKNADLETKNYNNQIIDLFEKRFDNVWESALPIIGDEKYFSTKFYPELVDAKTLASSSILISELAKRLQEYLANHQLEIVFEALLYFFFSILKNSEMAQTILILSSRYNRNLRKQQMNLVSMEDTEIEENKIIISLIEIIESIEKNSS